MSYIVTITQDMKDRCMQFARQIITTDNQFSRLLPNDIRTSGNQQSKQALEINRTYMGKLAELAFAEMLRLNGKQVDLTDIFAIYEGRNNVDTADFFTLNGNSVDVKAGYESFHSRLLVNCEQADSIPKNYYVGVKLNLINGNSQALIHGYVNHNELVTANRPQTFGEGYAYWLYYNQLRDINGLINMF